MAKKEPEAQARERIRLFQAEQEKEQATGTFNYVQGTAPTGAISYTASALTTGNT